MKQKLNGGEEVRACLVARGYEEECEVQSDSPTIDQKNIKILLAFCATNRWTPKTSDMKSGFLQGRKLDRLVNIKPPREAGLGKGSLWVLEVALYGLYYASLKFYIKCKDIFHNLGLTESKMDPALFYRLGKHDQSEEHWKLMLTIPYMVAPNLSTGMSQTNLPISPRWEKLSQKVSNMWDLT